jgi:hypothetical protein
LRRWNRLAPLTFAAAPCASLSQDVGKRGVGSSPIAQFLNALRSLHVDAEWRIPRETIGGGRVKAIVEVGGWGPVAL